MNKFWKWSKDEVSSNSSELILEGVIASESWWGDEVTPAMFREELKKHSGDLTVRINSPGGDVYAGVSIYNALVEHDGKVTVKVDGLAASIASVIAMAGDSIVMNPGAMMMVHKPWTVAMGNSDELEEAAAYLKKVGSSIVPIYTERTGQTEEKVNELLEAETWMTASEAVELGFADEAIKPKSNLSDAVNNALNYLKPVNNALMQPVMSIKTKLEAEHDANKVEEDNVSTDTPKTTEEVVVEPEPTPAQPTEPEPEPTAPTEPKDEEKVNNPVKEETNKMDDDKTTAIAQAQVITPENQAPVAPTATVKDYLKSKDSLEDFANVLAANAGREAKDVQAAWKSHISTKMNITNPEVLLPEGIINAIDDAFKQGGEIWNLVNKTGLDVFKVAWDTVTGENSRAKGHTRGDTKGEETITLEARTIRPQFVYKYLTLDKETVRENRSSGALLRYVLSELPKRVVRELERAIVIGDGRANDSDYKISKFVAVKADAAANNIFASRFVPEAGASRYESILQAADLLEADGPVYMVAKKGFLTNVKLEKTVNGGYLFQPGANLADAFELAGVIKPDWMADDADNDAYLVTFSEYRTVGDNSVEAFSNFVLKENKNEYLQEIYAGGALSARKAAVAIAVTPAVEAPEEE